jgi:hypothetical protein
MTVDILRGPATVVCLSADRSDPASTAFLIEHLFHLARRFVPAEFGWKYHVGAHLSFS